MRQRSSTSAATYLDNAERIEQLREAAERSRKRDPEIQQVILFNLHVLTREEVERFNERDRRDCKPPSLWAKTSS